MGLSDIAEGVVVTTEQERRGVPTTDDTDAPLGARLEPFADRLPCSATTAATLVEAYADGASIGRAAAVAEMPETAAAKTLYLLGEPIDPLTPTAKRALEDWLAGELSRTDALALAGVGPDEFALCAYVVTHDPIEGAETVVADALTADWSSDPLSDARSDAGEWL